MAAITHSQHDVATYGYDSYGNPHLCHLRLEPSGSVRSTTMTDPDSTATTFGPMRLANRATVSEKQKGRGVNTRP
jgi:hypothetical protein